MIPFSANVAELAVEIDSILTGLIETGTSPPMVRQVKKAGKRLLRLGGHDALFSAAQLISVRNCASTNRNLRIDMLQEAWAGIAKQTAKNKSLNAWRHRKAANTLLVHVEVGKAERHTLVALGRIQAHELDNKVEVAKAITDLLRELSENK